MGKSQQTFNKKEREKKKAKKRKEKQERRELRKQEKENRSKLTFEDQIMYMGHDGHLVKEKPDANKKNEVSVEDIHLGVPPNSKEAFEKTRQGFVKLFDPDKGYGFITDKMTKESIFVHINDAYDEIKQNHVVEFEVIKDHKGTKAKNVTQIK